jgi:hypothetical protein
MFEVEGIDAELFFDLLYVIYDNAVVLSHLWFGCVWTAVRLAISQVFAILIQILNFWICN